MQKFARGSLACYQSRRDIIVMSVNVCDHDWSNVSEKMISKEWIRSCKKCNCFQITKKYQKTKIWVNILGHMTQIDTLIPLFNEQVK